MSGLENRQLPRNKQESKPARSRDLSKAKATWDKKMAERKRLQQVKALSKQLRDEIKSEEERARAARKANRERRIENERRTMVTQDIKNVRAIKKLTPKQRRRARIVLKHEL